MYRVTIEQGNLRFSAAHFITFAGKCERLHGHNYAVRVTLAGDLTDDRYVFDFVDLKRIVKDLCDRLDHRFLLPVKSASLRITETDGEVEVRFKDRRYVLPRQDVLSLPLDNITAERLAEYLADQLVLELTRPGAKIPNVATLEVGVEESPGQTAYFSRSLLDRADGAKR